MVIFAGWDYENFPPNQCLQNLTYRLYHFCNQKRQKVSFCILVRKNSCFYRIPRRHKHNRKR